VTDFGATLSYSHIRPFDIEEVVAGWESTSHINDTVASGYVVKLLDGRYAYISSTRHTALDMIESLTRFHGTEEPKFLYDRARHWNHNKEELNADLPWQKTEAKYLHPQFTGGPDTA
jgi:phosphosulfolactate phosphohydrolase-like enzyme